MGRRGPYIVNVEKKSMEHNNLWLIPGIWKERSMIEKLAFGLYDLSKKLQNQILLQEFQIAKELFEDL